ncbi:multiheme c-type cytochrome [Dethiobacter alkaliphilus]|uniref:Multiheme cytochrome n=1 Tax=Dethiobacter alkaliphilus AHT 1 TaxID=555088 RepID=C0GHS4_DETAL|nr:multiheme c-type cytochrome [Dethiobacter alkaliphilus]EEG76998.1 multiheme cytochrome [Dethiobacter alkaliphilus AHT 1]
MSKKVLLVLVLGLVLVLAAGCGNNDANNQPNNDNDADDVSPAVAEFVGSDSCKGCHSGIYGEWEDSWHTVKALEGPYFGAENEANIYEWVRNDWDNLTTYMILDQADSNTLYVAAERTPVEEVAYVVGQVYKQRYTAYYDGGPREAFLATTEDGGISWTLNTDETVEFAGNKERAGYNFLFIETRPNETENPNKYGEHRSWQERCIACHTTGFDADAWDEAKEDFMAGEREDLKDIFVADLRVGCEACHGPGSVHNETRSAEDIINPANFTAYEDRMMTCEQCHDRNSRSMRSADANDARGFVVGQNLDDYRVQISPSWGTGSRNVSLDGKGRRGHQQNMDMRLSRFLGVGYHADQVCFDCHTPHGVGVNPDNLRLRDDVQSCTDCHDFDAAEAFDGSRGWEAGAFGAWGTEAGRGGTKQHLFNFNEDGLVYGLSPEQYTWVLKDDGDESEQDGWQAIWPWRLDELEAQGKTTFVGAEPWNQ